MPTGSKVTDKSNLATVESSILRNWAGKKSFRIQQYYSSYNLKCLKL